MKRALIGVATVFQEVLVADESSILDNLYHRRRPSVVAHGDQSGQGQGRQHRS